MIEFFSQTRDQLAEQLPVGRGEARRLAREAFANVYRRDVRDWEELPGLAPDVLRWLQREVPLSGLSVAHESCSTDGSRKVLFRLRDGETVESVLIPRALQKHRPLSMLGSRIKRLPQLTSRQLADRLQPRSLYRRARRRIRGRSAPGMTACLSTQIGCAMGCTFCLTGEQGLQRNLEVHEIVGQVVALRTVAQVDSIVFMGMGEPLHNTSNVIEACRILQDEYGFDYSGQEIIISTSGLTPEIERISRELDVNLGLSLNATTDELRRELMPVSKKWNIESVLGACRQYSAAVRGPVLIGYVLLDGVNDTDDDARRLASLVAGMDVLVTLIPHNEFATSPFGKPSRERCESFRAIVERAGVLVSIREPGGDDISAACGQLRSAVAGDRDDRDDRDDRGDQIIQLGLGPRV